MKEPFAISFADVEAAAARIEGHVLRTPLMLAPPRLSELTGRDCFGQA